jgi:sulfonate transport system permease protein
MSTRAVSPGPLRAPAVPGLTRLRRWTGPAVLLLAWQLVGSAGMVTDATPAAVARTALAMLADGSLGGATLDSVLRAAAGVALGAALALPLALVAGLSRVGAALLDLSLGALRLVPTVALLPLLLVVTGDGATPTVALVAVGVAIPLHLHTAAGLREADPTVLGAARALRLTRAQVVRHVVLPGALPRTFAGLRAGLAAGWVALVVAETATGHGLGALTVDAVDGARSDVLVVVLAVYGLLALLGDALVRLTARRALSWQ